MTLGLNLIQFSPETQIKSSDMNSNFTAINNAFISTGFSSVSTTKLKIGTHDTGAQVDSSGKVTIGDKQLKGYNTGTKCFPASFFTGTGPGVYNHGLGGGRTPDWCAPSTNGTNPHYWYAPNNPGSTTQSINIGLDGDPTPVSTNFVCLVSVST